MGQGARAEPQLGPSAGRGNREGHHDAGIEPGHQVPDTLHILDRKLEPSGRRSGCSHGTDTGFARRRNLYEEQCADAHHRRPDARSATRARVDRTLRRTNLAQHRHDNGHRPELFFAMGADGSDPTHRPPRGRRQTDARRHLREHRGRRTGHNVHARPRPAHKAFCKALVDFQNRERRFGKTSEQVESIQNEHNER